MSEPVNTHLMKAWIDALREGQYLQGREYMRRNYQGYTEHCCLGVLQEICLRQNLDFEPDWGQSSVTPYVVSEAIGLNASEQKVLAGMNDTGHTFAQIADFLEATYL